MEIFYVKLRIYNLNTASTKQQICLLTYFWKKQDGVNGVFLLPVLILYETNIKLPLKHITDHRCIEVVDDVKFLWDQTAGNEVINLVFTSVLPSVFYIGIEQLDIIGSKRIKISAPLSLMLLKKDWW